MSITLPGPGGNPIVVDIPEEKFKQNQSKTVVFETGGEHFQVDTIVKLNENQVAVATTSLRIQVDGEVVSSPTVEHHVGKKVELKSGDYGSTITIVRCKPPA